MRILAIVAALLVLIPACPNALPRTVPEDGSRLRLKMEGKNVAYLLDHIASDTLFVRHEKENALTPIAFDRIERAQVRVRRSSGW